MIVNDVTNDQNMYHVIECLLPPLLRCGGKLGCQVGSTNTAMHIVAPIC